MPRRIFIMLSFRRDEFHGFMPPIYAFTLRRCGCIASREVPLRFRVSLHCHTLHFSSELRHVDYRHAIITKCSSLFSLFTAPQDDR